MIEPIGRLQFRVPSTKARNPDGYVVDLEARTCTCPDWCFRKRPLKLDCQHIKSALLHLGEQVVKQMKQQTAK